MNPFTKGACHKLPKTSKPIRVEFKDLDNGDKKTFDRYKWFSLHKKIIEGFDL